MGESIRAWIWLRDEPLCRRSGDPQTVRTEYPGGDSGAPVPAVGVAQSSEESFFPIGM